MEIVLIKGRHMRAHRLRIPGEVIDVEEADAKDLVERGFARVFRTPQADPAPENAEVESDPQEENDENEPGESKPDAQTLESGPDEDLEEEQTGSQEENEQDEDEEEPEKIDSGIVIQDLPGA